MVWLNCAPPCGPLSRTYDPGGFYIQTYNRLPRHYDDLSSLTSPEVGLNATVYLPVTDKLLESSQIVN